MHHPVETLDALLHIHPELVAHLTTYGPRVELAQGMLSTPTNEGVSIIILGTPPREILLLRFREGDNPMPTARESSIQEDDLPLLQVGELWPMLLEDARVALDAACKPPGEHNRVESKKLHKLGRFPKLRAAGRATGAAGKAFSMLCEPPPKRGVYKFAPALDLTTSIRGDFVACQKGL